VIELFQMDEVKESPQSGELKTATVIEGLGTPEPVDYKKVLGDARTIFLSDDHGSFLVKDASKDALAELSKLGVTDLALEMLPEGFDTTDGDAVTEYLKKNWDKSPGMAEKYKELIDYAKSLGLRVWGLDISAQSYQAKSISDTFVERNQQWADLIADRLIDTPDAKVVVFGGSAHSGYYPVGDRANNLLDKKGNKSVVVNYWGGDSVMTYLPEAKLVHDYIQNNNIESGFMVRIANPSRSSDYIVHIAQVAQQHKS